METKPYSLQSPEQIAKDYGGNKQKIANAAQMGLLDPTAAVMAGMFIDRMRSAQQQEQQPQQTVAQQVFSPQPPAPPPGAPPMGAAPQGAPPQQPMPQQPMPQQGGQPPMGMAGGGLMDLSIDPSMFDEPSNGAYASGGLVAFADGGEVFWLPSKGQYVNADGEPVSAPAPGSIVDVGAQRLIGSGYVRSGSKYTVPGGTARAPAYGPSSYERGSGRPVREFKPGDTVPFSDSGLGRVVGDLTNFFTGTPEQNAATKKGLAARADREAYERSVRGFGLDSALARVFGGTIPVHPNLRPLPVAPASDKPTTQPPATARTAAVGKRTGADTPRPPAPAPRQQISVSTEPSMSPEARLQPQAVPAPARGLGALAPQQAPAMPPAAAPVQGAPAPAGPAGPAGPERPTLTAAMDEMKGLYGDLPTGARDALSAYYDRIASPEALAAQKKQDMWSAMAQMGFNMASSNSPYFLQAVGQAGAQAVPAMQAAAKERRAMEREGLQARAGIESQQRAERGDMVKGATSLYGTQLQASESAADRASREKISSEEIAARIAISAADNATSIRVAQIGAGARGGGDGGVGARKFSSSMPQRLAQQHYEEAMSLMMQAVAANPEAQRAYAANPEAYRAKYERRAYQLSLEYGARRAAEIGGNGGSYTNPEQQVGGRTSTQGRPPLTSFDR